LRNTDSPILPVFFTWSPTHRDPTSFFFYPTWMFEPVSPLVSVNRLVMIQFPFLFPFACASPAKDVILVSIRFALSLNCLTIRTRPGPKSVFFFGREERSSRRIILYLTVVFSILFQFDPKRFFFPTNRKFPSFLFFSRYYHSPSFFTVDGSILTLPVIDPYTRVAGVGSLSFPPLAPVLFLQYLLLPLFSSPVQNTLILKCCQAKNRRKSTVVILFPLPNFELYWVISFFSPLPPAPSQRFLVARRLI